MLYICIVFFSKIQSWFEMYNAIVYFNKAYPKFLYANEKPAWYDKENAYFNDKFLKKPIYGSVLSKTSIFQ